MKNKSSVTEHRDVMKTLRERSRGKRITKIILVIVLIAVLFIGIVGWGMKSRGDEMQAAVPQQQTEEVTKRSLTKSVGATGTIVSVQSKDLSVSLSGIEVASIHVKVGDTVEAGEELLRFDTSDIEEKLSDAQSALGKAQQKNSISQADAQRNVADAERTESYQVDNAKTNMDTSYRDYQSALSSYESAYAKISELQSAENAANSNYSAAQQTLSEAADILNQKKAACDSAGSAYEAAKASYESATGDAGLRTAYESAEKSYNEAKSAYEAAQSGYNTAFDNVTSAQAAYETAKSSREAQQSTIDSLFAQVQAKSDAYDSAVKNYDNTVAGQASTVASAKSSQTNTALNASTDTEENQVEQYQEQLEEGVLTAPISGIVTAVNYEVGDIYTQGTILTIQDCSSYEVEAEIGEYDISDIEVGQRVLIKTDATGDEELQGTVTFVSPTAAASASASAVTGTSSGTSGGNVNYKVRISVDTPNDRLRLDMSASLSIIIEQHDDVLTVPYNAVQTDEDGGSFIRILSGDGTGFTDVPVEVVMESNYYTEIKAEDLKEGQKVLVVESPDDNDGMMMDGMGRGGF